MCGIAGLSALPGQKTPNARGVLAALRHRGPDGEGAFEKDGVLLVHTRLAILDLSSAGEQPMRSHDGRYVITFNGEIYNFMSLRRELEASGVVFRSRSDTEVLLEGYARLGAEFLTRLNGIYALAIYDTLSGELFIARDPLGVKPLYWAEGAFGFGFASEVKALLQVAPVERRIDPLAVEKYLTFLWCPGEGTPMQAVRKLDPGAALIVREGRIQRRWRFWTPPTYRPRTDWSRAQCVADLRDAVDQAVDRQMVSDAPVGALLSGGVDSTAIVAAARRVAPDIACFTMRIKSDVPTDMDDDLGYARKAAKALGVPLTEVDVSSQDIIDQLASMVEMLDEPLADPAALNLYFIAKAARRQGIKVLLSGAGGDDLFSGYRRHTASKLNPVWDMAPAGLRQGLAKAGGRLGRRRPVARRLAKLLAEVEGGRDERLMRAFAWTPSTTAAALVGNDADFAPGGAVWQDFAAEIAGDAGAPDLEKGLRLDRRFFLADHNLLYTDKMGMAAGVEIRVPLLDLQLVEFASHIPAAWKHRGAAPKWAFKASQRGVIPDAIIDRPKRGFGAPLRQWMQLELRPLREDLLSPDTLRRRGLFDPGVAQRLLQDTDDGAADGTYTLFSMMCLELWCRRFIDADGPNSRQPMYDSTPASRTLASGALAS